MRCQQFRISKSLSEDHNIPRSLFFCSILFPWFGYSAISGPKSGKKSGPVKVNCKKFYVSDRKFWNSNFNAKSFGKTVLHEEPYFMPQQQWECADEDNDFLSLGGLLWERVFS